MTVTLTGVDSESAITTSADICGVYVGGEGAGNVWTRDEVARCGARGILPIVVPSQAAYWWRDVEFAQRLVAQAKAWGVPYGSPLCIDVEETDEEAIMDAGEAYFMVSLWRTACMRAELYPWIYAGRTLFSQAITSTCNRWLAEWPTGLPTDPQVPPGFSGWQYHGDPNGESGPDLDVFMPGVYMKPDASRAILVGIPLAQRRADMPWVAHIGKGTDSQRFYLVDGVATKVDESTGDLHNLEAAGFPVVPVTFDTIASRVIDSVPPAPAPVTTGEPATGEATAVGPADDRPADDSPAEVVPSPPTADAPPAASPPKDDSPSGTPSQNGSDGEESSDDEAAADPVVAPVSVVSGDDDWATRRSRGEV